jgi:hypothetical protein
MIRQKRARALASKEQWLFEACILRIFESILRTRGRKVLCSLWKVETILEMAKLFCSICTDTLPAFVEI